MLMQSKLAPDTDIIFADKGSLLRFDNSSISLANYEEWLTSYIDDELTEEERKSVEEFIAINPAAQKELGLLQQTKLQPEAIVFPYKESLYRRTEKARVISLRWMRIAAAAVLLLALGTTAVVLLNNKNGNSTTSLPVAQDNQGKAKVNNGAKQPANEAQLNELAPSTADKKKTESNEKESVSSNPIAVNQKNSAKEKKQQVEPAKDEKPPIAYHSSKEDTFIEPPQSIDNSTANGNRTKATDIAASGLTTSDHSLTVPKEKSGSSDVTTSPVDRIINETGAVKQNNPDVQFASDNSGNKGLRGFFRKVTRTIEKRTNIKATDDDDRLLIAGLAIKMN
jgi:hypothetical protein